MRSIDGFESIRAITGGSIKQQAHLHGCFGAGGDFWERGLQQQVSQSSLVEQHFAV